MDLEQQYLSAAYGLARNDSMNTFDENEVAASLGLDRNDPGQAERLASLTQHHLDRGSLAPHSKVGVTGEGRILKLTVKGQEEAKRP